MSLDLILLNISISLLIVAIIVIMILIATNHFNTGIWFYIAYSLAFIGLTLSTIGSYLMENKFSYIVVGIDLCLLVWYIYLLIKHKKPKENIEPKENKCKINNDKQMKTKKAKNIKTERLNYPNYINIDEHKTLSWILETKKNFIIVGFLNEEEKISFEKLLFLYGIGPGEPYRDPYYEKKNIVIDVNFGNAVYYDCSDTFFSEDEEVYIIDKHYIILDEKFNKKIHSLNENEDLLDRVKQKLAEEKNMKWLMQIENEMFDEQMKNRKWVHDHDVRHLEIENKDLRRHNIFGNIVK